MFLKIFQLMEIISAVRYNDCSRHLYTGITSTIGMYQLNNNTTCTAPLRVRFNNQNNGDSFHPNTSLQWASLVGLISACLVNPMTQRNSELKAT